MAYRNYATANGFIVANDGNGDFPTISAALAVATSGTTIFIRPGTYTENPTLVAGVNIAAFTGDNNTPNVTINGKCTFSGTGTVSLSNIRLQTNSDFCVVVSGANASVLQLNNCLINCLNNTGISFTSSNAASQIIANYCTGNLATTGIALHSSSSPGTIGYFFCSIVNLGLSTTVTNNSAGLSNFFYCSFPFPIGTTSTGGINVVESNIDCTLVNSIALTANGTGTSNARLSYFAGGTASAVTIGTGATLTVLNCSINSANANAISGVGTLNLGNAIDFTNSKVINTTTQTSTNSGSWTPSITIGGGTTGITYTMQTGKFTRLGNIIYITAQMTLSSKGALTGNVALAGLPFTSSANATEVWACATANVNFGSVPPMLFFLNLSNTTGNFGLMANAGAITVLQNTGLSNTSVIYLDGVYSTA